MWGNPLFTGWRISRRRSTIFEQTEKSYIDSRTRSDTRNTGRERRHRETWSHKSNKCYSRIAVQKQQQEENHEEIREIQEHHRRKEIEA